MLKKMLANWFVNRSKKRKRDIKIDEKRHPNPNLSNYNDSFYFTGHSDDGTSLVTRLGFRNGGKTESWLSLRIPALGELHLRKDDDFKPGNDVSAGPLQYKCLKPGRNWRLTYRGNLLGEKGNTFTKIDLNYKSEMPIFNYATDADKRPIAKAISKPKWTGNFFKKLKDIEQVHYEQGGIITGIIEVDGKPINVNMRAYRDHTFGSRDWAVMEKHIWLGILLEDNTFANISIVKFDFLPTIETGYISKNGINKPVTVSSTFEDISTCGNPPQAFSLSFLPTDGEACELDCKMDGAFQYTMEDTYLINEGLAKFKLGRLSGIGIAEFGNRK